MQLPRVFLLGLWALMIGLRLSVAAQAPGVPVLDDEAYRKKVTSAAESLLKAGKLLRLDSFESGLTANYPKTVDPLAPNHATPLSATQIYQRARRAMLSIGTLYRCGKCDLWHINLSGGYAIDSLGTAVTSLHIVEKDGHPESYLLAADPDGRVFPVLEILGVHSAADAVILKTTASGLEPLPLQTHAFPGDPVFCLSNPSGVRELFTTGVVSRFFSKAGTVFLAVTADWASGSSGSPILDCYGNVLGHVTSTRPLKSNGSSDSSRYVQTVLKQGTSAAEILKLLRPPRNP